MSCTELDLMITMEDIYVNFQRTSLEQKKSVVSKERHFQVFQINDHFEYILLSNFRPKHANKLKLGLARMLTFTEYTTY